MSPAQNLVLGTHISHHSSHLIYPLSSSLSLVESDHVTRILASDWSRRRSSSLTPAPVPGFEFSGGERGLLTPVRVPGPGMFLVCSDPFPSDPSLFYRQVPTHTHCRGLRRRHDAEKRCHVQIYQIYQLSLLIHHSVFLLFPRIGWTVQRVI